MVSIGTLGRIAAPQKRIGSIGNGHLENWKGQVGRFGGVLAFLPIMRLTNKIKTLALLTDGG